MYTFKEIFPTKEDWKKIENSSESTIYQTEGWIAYLAKIGCKPIIIEVNENNVTIGHFIGTIIGKGVRFVLSPQEGVGTYNQGLCMQVSILEEKRLDIYKSLSKWLFDNNTADVLQVDDWHLRRTSAIWIPYEEFKHDTLESRNIHYSVRPTLSCPVNISKEDMWKGLHYSSCKYCINKAKKHGLYVKEITSFNEIKDFVHIHYEQLKDVCDRHGTIPSISQHYSRMLALCESLFPSRIIMLEVLGSDENGKERIMSTGIFCMDKGECSYWTGASFRKYQKYSPNELMVWEAMCKLNERGGGILNFCGMAKYKLKFGTKYEYVPRITYAKYKCLAKCVVNILPKLKKIYNRLRSII